jgi:hypothetical protein
MDLKSLQSKLTLPSRKGGILFLPIILIIISAFVFPISSGCTPPQETRQLVIQSELEPEAVLPDFGGRNYSELTYEAGDKDGHYNEIASFIDTPELGNDFVKAYGRYYSLYVFNNGKQIGIYFDVLRVIVFKYETKQGAEEAFNLFSEIFGLEELTLDGLKIKWKQHHDEPAVYMLQSNNFVIYIDGYPKAGRDAVSAIIELYAVPLNKDN